MAKIINTKAKTGIAMTRLLKKYTTTLVLVLFALDSSAQTFKNTLNITEEKTVDTTYYVHDIYKPKDITIATQVKDTVINGLSYKKIKCTQFVRSTGPKSYYTIYEHASANLLSVLDAKFATIHNIKFVVDTANQGILFGKQGIVRFTISQDYGMREVSLTKPGYVADVRIEGDTVYSLTYSLANYAITKTENGNNSVSYYSDSNVDKIIKGFNYSGPPIKLEYNKLKPGDYAIFSLDNLGKLLGTSDKMYFKLTHQGDTVFEGRKSIKFGIELNDGLKTTTRPGMGKADFVFETDSTYEFSKYNTFSKGPIQPYLGIDSVQKQQYHYDDNDDYVIDDNAPIEYTTKVIYRGILRDTINGKIFPKLISSISSPYTLEGYAFKDAMYVYSFFPVELPATISYMNVDFKPVALKINGVETGKSTDFANAIQEFEPGIEEFQDEYKKRRIEADSLEAVEAMTNPLTVNDDNKNKYQSYIESVEVVKKTLKVKFYLSIPADVTVGIKETDYSPYSIYNKDGMVISLVSKTNLTAGWQTLELPKDKMTGNINYHVFLKYNKPGMPDSAQTVALTYFNEVVEKTIKPHSAPKASSVKTVATDLVVGAKIVANEGFEFDIDAPEEGVILISITSASTGTNNATTESFKATKGARHIKVNMPYDFNDKDLFSVSIMLVGKQKTFTYSKTIGN